MSRGDKWIPLDKYLAQEFKSIKREFSMIEAMFSYTLDIDNGHNGSISGYSKLWGWSRNKVRRFINCIGTPEGHHRDRKRTGDGHPIHFIDKALWSKKDTIRTGRGQEEDTQEDTTNKPKPKPKPNQKKKHTKKISFLGYLEEQIIQNNFIESKDKIFEFYEYRMEMPAAKKYKSEKGINGLFRDLNGCRDNGLIISDCIDIAIERDWLRPDPTYFKNNFNKGQKNGKTKNFTGKDTRENILGDRLPEY